MGGSSKIEINVSASLNCIFVISTGERDSCQRSRLTLTNTVLVRDIVLNDTFNISPISCWSVLFVDKTGVHEEKHRPVAIH